MSLLVVVLQDRNGSYHAILLFVNVLQLMQRLALHAQNWLLRSLNIYERMEGKMMCDKIHLLVM
jgi:hypothetical protein